MFWHFLHRRPRKAAAPAAGADELEALRAASAGLLYPSETDAPFDVVADAQIPAVATEQSLDAFFDALKDGDDAGRFAALRRAIDVTLAGAKVYRAGERQVQVYVLGRTRSGRTAGLHTTSVET